MRILGIDPGSRVTGFGVVQVLRNGRIEYIASGCVRVPKGELADRLKTVYDGVTEIIKTYQPTMLAIEKVFMAKNADSALKLGQARGAATAAGAWRRPAARCRRCARLRYLPRAPCRGPAIAAAAARGPARDEAAPVIG